LYDGEKNSKQSLSKMTTMTLRPLFSTVNGKEYCHLSTLGKAAILALIVCNPNEASGALHKSEVLSGVQ